MKRLQTFFYVFLKIFLQICIHSMSAFRKFSSNFITELPQDCLQGLNILFYEFHQGFPQVFLQ